MVEAVDPLEFGRDLAGEPEPLYEAWFDVWLHGSAEAVTVTSPDRDGACAEHQTSDWRAA